MNPSPVSFLFLFGRAHAAENIGHRVIAFVAGILEKLILVVLFQLHEDSPRSCPCLLVIHGYPVFHTVVADSRESFGHSQLLAMIAGISWVACAVGTDRILVREI